MRSWRSACARFSAVARRSASTLTSLKLFWRAARRPSTLKTWKPYGDRTTPEIFPVASEKQASSKTLGMVALGNQPRSPPLLPSGEVLTCRASLSKATPARSWSSTLFASSGVRTTICRQCTASGSSNALLWVS